MADLSFPDVVPFWSYVAKLQASGMSLAPAVYMVASIVVSDAAIATQSFPVDVPNVGPEHWPDADGDGVLEQQLGDAFNRVGRKLDKLVAWYLEADARRIIAGSPRKGVVPTA